MKKSIKHSIKIAAATLLIATLMIGQFPLGVQQVSAAVKLTPNVLTTGSDAELKNSSHYTFDSDGFQLYTLTIPADGCLVAYLSAQYADYVNVEIHKKADGSDLPTAFAFQCTTDRNNFDTNNRYLTKGTYYLRFPANSYILDMDLFSSAPKTLKDGSTVAAYCDYNTEDVFTYRAPETGYITLTQKRLINTGASYDVVLCNKKESKLSDVVCDHDIERDVIFPVKKGVTYKIKVKTLNVDGQQFYRMNLNFTKRIEKSGSSKSKAVKATISSYTHGMIFSEDALSRKDWYKFSNPKSQNLSLTALGFATSGSIDFTVYNSKGKAIGIYHLMPGNEKGNTVELVNINGKRTHPKGTYYVSVKKTRKETAGIYSFKIVKK